jgi:carboxymethylenebutenolidase
MIQEEFEIPMSDGSSECVLCRPDGDGPWPGVIHLTDIGGIRPAQIEMIRRLASEGYAVLAPNVFYRTSRLPVLTLDPAAGNDERMKRFGELAAPLTPERIESDAGPYVDFLTGNGSVQKGSIGVVGYCFTGAVALRFAAAQNESVAAAASFHGGRLFTDAETSPHRVLPRVKARLYFGHAIEDKSMPAEAIGGLDVALAAWDGRYESETYEGAYHGWTTPDSPVYNAPRAERAFAKLTGLFNETLR